MLVSIPTPLHHSHYITNMAIAQGVKCQSSHAQFLNSLSAPVLLSVNVLLMRSKNKYLWRKYAIRDTRFVLFDAMMRVKMPPFRLLAWHLSLTDILLSLVSQDDQQQTGRHSKTRSKQD